MASSAKPQPLVDYRTQASATKGDQILVERQYQASPGVWVTTGKYLTASLGKVPKKPEEWMRKVPSLFDAWIEVGKLADGGTLQAKLAPNYLMQAQESEKTLAAKLRSLRTEERGAVDDEVILSDTADPHVTQVVKPCCYGQVMTENEHSEDCIDKEQAEKILPSRY